MKKAIPAISLFLICLVTSLALALVSEITAPLIAIQAEASQTALQKEVMPDADSFSAVENFEATTVDSGATITKAFTANKGSELLGYVFVVEKSGYGGPIQVMLSITADQKIGGLRILSNTETPGLGANAATADFYTRYDGKDINTPLTVVKAGMTTGNEAEIEAIASATITTTAVTVAATAAMDLAKTWIANGGTQ